MEGLPFGTPLERMLVFSQAKSGDSVAIAFLWREYACRVFTWEEVEAVNLLLENGVLCTYTKTWLRAKERQERDEERRRRWVTYS